MKLKSFKEVKDMADSIIKKYCLLEDDKQSDKTTCEYYLGEENERFCKMTSQISCRACRYYSPSEMAKRMVLLNHVHTQEELLKKEREKHDKYVQDTEPYVKAYERIMSAKTR